MAETSTITSLNDWYKKPIGQALLKAELIGLTNVLSTIFGYYLIQIGGPIDDPRILASSRIHNHILVNTDIDVTTNNDLKVQCQLDELPFLPESIDAIVLFHTLEFTKKPMTILNEIYTTLIPNGYAIILGFNPYSLWGITSLWKKSQEIPWNGHWISPGHMRHWLHKVGFNIGDYQTFYFRPPNNNTDKLLFLEGIGQIFWPYCGTSYMFVAHKTVTGLTPIKPLLFTKPLKEGIKAFPKPTARV